VSESLEEFRVAMLATKDGRFAFHYMTAAQPVALAAR
jgi:hypothetical protein